MVLSIPEKLEIIELARRNSYRQTAIIFNQLHPDRYAPLHFTTIAKLFQNLRSRGSLERKKRTVSPRMAVEINNFREEVLVRINENPHLSTRRVAAQLGKSHTSVWKVLKYEKFKSYKMSKHQKLHADDPPKRKKFGRICWKFFDKIQVTSTAFYGRMKNPFQSMVVSIDKISGK